MKSLPAARRESATTTLKKGRFLAPPRERRITTMMNTEAEKGVILRELRCDWQGKAESEEAIGASPTGNHTLPKPGTRRERELADFRRRFPPRARPSLAACASGATLSARDWPPW